MTTYRGRVVYNRKLHPFRYRDLNRIARVVSPMEWKDLPDVYFTMLRVAEDLAKLGGNTLDLLAEGRVPSVGLLPVRITPGLALHIMAFLLGIVANLGEGALDLLRREGRFLIPRLLSFFGGFFAASESVEETEGT